MLHLHFAVRQLIFSISSQGLTSAVCSTNDNPYQHLFGFVLCFCLVPDVQHCMHLALWFLPQFFTFCLGCWSHSASQYPQDSLSNDHHFNMIFYSGLTRKPHQAAILSLYCEDTNDVIIPWCTSQVGYTFGQGPPFQTFAMSLHRTTDANICPRKSLAKLTIAQPPCLNENGVVWLVGYSRRRLIFDVAEGYISYHITYMHLQSHDWKLGTRIGEASNPGPPLTSTSDQSITISLVNPTTIYQKEDDLLSLNSDVLCLAETAATRTVQHAFNQAIRTTPYRTFWSAPVPDKITKTNPQLGTTLRGDNLGTAILTRLPSRDPRHVFPPVVWETCRVNSTIVSTGCLDILIVSTYFQTGKSAEARVVNNQLLHDLLSYVLSIDLPFVIAGDFNTDIHKLDAFTYFRNMGCQEMFQFHRQAFGFDLPPTCKGATRFDSMIIHPVLAKYIHRIDIGPEHQFADHCVAHVQFNLPTKLVDTHSWFAPKSWTVFSIPQDTFACQYRRTRCPAVTSLSADPAECLHQWSLRIEKALHQTLNLHKATEPLQQTQGFLPKTFRGRCAPPRLVRNSCPRTPKHDITGQYEPPTEVTSLKSRQKVRQVRRLRSLERLFKKYDLLDSHLSQCVHSSRWSELQHLWQVICSANGYGSSWDHWILQFESIPAVPQDLPTYDQLYSFRQITQYDADLYCQHEAKLQRQSRQHALNLDIQYKSCSQFYYKRLKDSEVKVLPGFPIKLTAQASLCRSDKGPVMLTIHQPVSFRLYAAATFGTAQLRIMEQCDSRIRCHVLHGCVPTHGDLVQEVFAFDVHQMAAPFAEYWSQFWNRDSQQDECSDQPWIQTLDTLCARIPPSTPLQVQWDDPDVLQQTIRRLKPFKAVGIDGWRAEELQSLPYEAVADLASILAVIWPTGLSAHQLIARVILLAKRQPPTAITDGRPITILGYLSRLTSKLIADQLLNQWATAWPSAISGGLPFRGVQDITFMQQFQIESAKHRSLPWRGFTLDLIKAFNLLPRRVIYHLLIYHGPPPPIHRILVSKPAKYDTQTTGS